MKYVQQYIKDVETIEAGLEDFDVEVSNEGRIRQIAGAVKDKVIMKDLRNALKISGWTGWSVSRMHKGIDALEEAMVTFIDEYIEEHDLKGKEVPFDALDSWMAWDDYRVSSVYLLDKKRFPDVLEAAESGPTWKIFVTALKTEVNTIFTQSEVREVVSDRIKTFEDFKVLFKEACDNCRKLVDIAKEDSWAKVPRAIFTGHYVGVNGLVAVAAQFRSAMRRAI